VAPLKKTDAQIQVASVRVLGPLHCAFQCLLYWRKQTLRINFSGAEKCPKQ
jgi:hypothetical protein